MKIYYFRCGYEWYFTEGPPGPDSKMLMLFVDAKNVIQVDEERYPFIRGWSAHELEGMFSPLIDSCVIT